MLGPWQLAAGVLAIVAFSCVWWKQSPDSDYWWHLASGRYAVTMHTLAVPDPFSFTAAGRTWVAHEWLTEAAMYGLQDAFGDGGPLALFALCAALTAALTLHSLRRIGTHFLPANFWTLAMIVALVPSLGPRPDLVAFALTAAEIWLLERWFARRDRGIWLLPCLICLWVNVHGSWPAGLALPVLILLGDVLAVTLRWQDAVRLDRVTRLQLGVAIAASLAALLINANGVAGVLYPLTHFLSPLNDRIGGNEATSLGAPYAWPFFLLVGAYVAMLAVRRPRLPAADLLIAVSFVTAALWIWRLVPFAVICLAPLIGRILTRPNESGAKAPPLIAGIGAWHDRWGRRLPSPSALRQCLNAGILLLLAAAGVSKKPYDLAHAGHQPVAAVDALAAGGMPGPLFNDDRWGGYLTWRLWPHTRVFIDDRGVDLYSGGRVFRDYLQVFDSTADAETVLDAYAIQTVLVRKDWPLVPFLLATGKWQATYQDNLAIKLERKGSDARLVVPSDAGR